MSCPVFYVYFLLTFLLLGCGKPITVPERSESPLEADISSLRWGSEDLPIDLRVSQAFPVAHRNQAQEAMNLWEAAAGMDFFRAITTTPNKQFSSLTDYYYQDRLVQGIYLASGPVDEMGPGTLAVAQVFYYLNRENAQQPYYHIVHADIVVNGHDYEFSTDPLDDTSYYFLSLILHEIGHVLGLSHFNQGIMYPSLSTLDKDQTLSNFDRNLIQSRYQAGAAPLNGLVKVKSTQESDGLLKVQFFLYASSE